MEISRRYSSRKKGKEQTLWEEIMPYSGAPNYPSRNEGLITFKVTEYAYLIVSGIVKC